MKLFVIMTTTLFLAFKSNWSVKDKANKVAHNPESSDPLKYTWKYHIIYIRLIVYLCHKKLYAYKKMREELVEFKNKGFFMHFHVLAKRVKKFGIHKKRKLCGMVEVLEGASPSLLKLGCDSFCFKIPYTFSFPLYKCFRRRFFVSFIDINCLGIVRRTGNKSGLLEITSVLICNRLWSDVFM